MSVTPTHHPDQELLAAYAAGVADPDLALVIEAHAALCPICAEELRRFEMIGGALLDAVAPVPMDAGALDAVLARIDGGTSVVTTATTSGIQLGEIDPELARLPEPVRSLAARRLAETGWRAQIPGIKTLDLAPSGAPESDARLIRLEPGAASPKHTHKGMEYTLVLTGAFSDQTGRYGPGDFAAASSDVMHQPTAEEGEVCISLAVTTAPLQMTGALGLIQRLMGQ